MGDFLCFVADVDGLRMERETRTVDLRVSGHRLLPLLATETVLGSNSVRVLAGDRAEVFGGRADVTPRVDPPTQDGQKFGEESSVHVSAHLVEHEPVAERAPGEESS